MTELIVNDVAPINRYTASAGAQDFIFEFPVLDAEDLEVLIDGVVTGDYGATGIGESTGGTVILDEALAGGEQVILRRRTVLERTSNLLEGGRLPIAALNREYNKIFLILQEGREDVSRALKLPFSIDPGTVSDDLPEPVARRALVWNEDADAIVNSETDPDEAAAEAAASAAAASASATEAETAKTAAELAETNAETAETAAEAAQAAAVAAAALAQEIVESMIWQDVVFLTFADSPYTIQPDDAGKMFSVNATGGAVVINLPLISGLDLTKPWAIAGKKTDASGNAVTFNRAGGDQIDGGTSKALSIQNNGAVFIPDTDTTPDEWTTNDFGPTAIPDGSITKAKIENSAGNSVPGRAANTVGVLADIVAGTDGHVLRLAGTTLGFGQLALAAIADGFLTADAAGRAKLADQLITYAKIQNVSATARLLGRKTAGAGVTEELTLSEVLDLIGSATRGDILYRGAATWERLPKGTAGHVLTQGADDPAWAASSGGGETRVAEQACSSGATNEFNGLPAGLKGIILFLYKVSTSGDDLLCQLRTGGAYVTTGYTGGANDGGGVQTSTAGLSLTRNNAAANTASGFITLRLVDAATDKWEMSCNLFLSSGDVHSSSGEIDLAGDVDGVRILNDAAGSFDGAGTTALAYWS